MIEQNIKILNKEEFIKDFVKKLEKILEKAPIQALAKVVGESVDINISHISKKVTFIIDFRKTVSNNIHAIKEVLYPYYPTIDFISQEEKNYSPEEIEILVQNGSNLFDALNKTKIETKVEEYKITKVIIKKDLIFLQKLDNPNGEELLYRMTIPLSIFMKRLRYKWSREEVAQIFKEKAKFEKILYPKEVWETMNKTTNRVEVVNE